MDLISHFKWLVFGKILGIIILVINVPIAESRTVENTVVSNIPTNISFSHFSLNQSHDKIKLEIIEQEIEQFDVILMPHNNRYRRDISSPFAPGSNSSAFESIENEIRNIQEQLSKMTNSTLLNTEDKLKISDLETKLKNLLELIYNLKSDLRNKDEEKEKQIQNTIRKFETTIINGIVRSILMRQFSFAETQLQSANDSTFMTVLQLVYNHQQADNFNLISSFGDSIENVERKFKIYETLYLESKTNNNLTTEKLLLLTQNLKKILTNNSKDAIANNAKLLICNLWNENQRSAVEAISTAYFDDSFKEMAKKNSEDIFLNCNFANRYTNVSDIYKKVIENVFDKVSTQDILNEAFCNLQPSINIAESAALNEAVFDKLEAVNKLSTNAVIPLARRVKTLMENSNYTNLDLEFRNRQEYIKSKLPISIKNLVFSSVICLKNTKLNEYLFAGTDDQVLDSARRFVFTWIPQNKNGSTFKWKANFRDDNGIHLVNVALKEYLFDCELNKYDHRRRYVFTWRKKGGDSMQDNTWNIEVVDEDSVRIKNRFHNEYLYADFYEQRDYICTNKIRNADSYEQRDEFSRHVFTYIPKNQTYDSTWSIIDCSE